MGQGWAEIRKCVGCGNTEVRSNGLGNGHALYLYWKAVNGCCVCVLEHWLSGIDSHIELKSLGIVLV